MGSLRRNEKSLKEEFKKSEKERRRWQKAFSKMEGKYRSAKRDKKRFEADAETLQSRVNLQIEQIIDLERRLLNSSEAPRQDSANTDRIQRLEDDIRTKDLLIHDLERQLAGSRASSRWSGTKHMAAQLVA